MYRGGGVNQNPFCAGCPLREVFLPPHLSMPLASSQGRGGVGVCSRWSIKNLLTPLVLMGCFPRDFQEGKRPTKVFTKQHIEVGKRPIKERKRPIIGDAPEQFKSRYV